MSINSIVRRSVGLLFLAGALGAGFPEQTDWVTVQTIERIPVPVLKALQARFKGDSRFADRGQPFEAIDVVSKLPTRRLVLAGHTSTEWFVVYEHGGRGHHLDLVVFNVRAGSPYPVLVTSPIAGTHDDRTGWRLTLEDLLPTLSSARANVVDDEQVHY